MVLLYLYDTGALLVLPKNLTKNPKIKIKTPPAQGRGAASLPLRNVKMCCCVNLLARRQPTLHALPREGWYVTRQTCAYSTTRHARARSGEGKKSGGKEGRKGGLEKNEKNNKVTMAGVLL